MAHTVTLIPGDGIGSEVSAAAVRVIDAAGADIEWQFAEAGDAALKKHGSPVPRHVIDAIRATGVALKGPLMTPVGKGFRSANVTLRQELELFANLRPVKSIPGVESHFTDVDLVIVRENSEDLYLGIETEDKPGVVHAIKVVTEVASRRIAKWSLAYATSHSRSHVTVVHKANIMKLSDGLFLRSFQEEAKAYPSLRTDDRIIDALCMDLVINPAKYDVLVLGNLYGDIVSDLCAGLVGGLGLVPGANIGESAAVFEAVHGSAPDIAGKNLANPSALILSGIMMLRHLNNHPCADRIERALFATLAEKSKRTRDLGGPCYCDEFANHVIAALEAAL